MQKLFSFKDVFRPKLFSTFRGYTKQKLLQDSVAGMIVGIHNRENDLDVNPCKNKNLTNTRSAGADEAINLTRPKIMSLEEALEFIEDDELVEVTPTDIRLRKKILDSKDRYRSNR